MASREIKVTLDTSELESALDRVAEVMDDLAAAARASRDRLRENHE